VKNSRRCSLLGWQLTTCSPANRGRSVTTWRWINVAVGISLMHRVTLLDSQCPFLSSSSYFTLRDFLRARSEKMRPRRSLPFTHLVLVSIFSTRKSTRIFVTNRKEPASRKVVGCLIIFMVVMLSYTYSKMKNDTYRYDILDV
jgi:hypothetical protein